MNQSTVPSTRQIETQRRYSIIKIKFNEIYSQKVNGMRLNYDDVIEKVSQEVGFRPRTIKDILKK